MHATKIIVANLFVKKVNTSILNDILSHKPDKVVVVVLIHTSFFHLISGEEEIKLRGM